MAEKTVITEPLLVDDESSCSNQDATSKKPTIFIFEIIGGSVLCGMSNFFYGLLDNQDFEVTCLLFSGFLTVVIIYKIMMMICNQSQTSQVDIRSFFMGQMGNLENFGHLILRVISYFLNIWFVILIAQYCSLSGMNIGIATSIFCFCIVIQTIIGYVVYNERLSFKMILYMGVVAGGIIWLILSKESNTKTSMNEEEQVEAMKNKLIAIILALTTATLISLRFWQARQLYLKKGYSATDFTIDSSLMCGLVTLILSGYFYYMGHPSYTMHNFIISFFASSVATLSSIMILNAINKGLQGPSVAIFQSHALVTTLLAMIFLSQIPSLSQLLSMAMIIGGVVMIIVNK